MGYLTKLNISRFAHVHNFKNQMYFATANGSKSILFYFKFPTGKKIVVDWGDGTTNEYNGNGNTNVNLSHTYPGPGVFPIKLSGDYILLTSADCHSMNLSGDISHWSNYLPNLTDLKVYYNNTLSGDITGWSSFLSISPCWIARNQFTGDVSGFKTMTSASQIHIFGNPVSFLDNSPWTSVTAEIQMYDCLFSQQDVDNALVAFLGSSIVNKLIRLNGTNAAPSAIGESAIDTLRQRGNTVLVTGGY